ncbi:peptide ABC transporter ATPase [Cellulomonas sp. A375-1]|uniref:Dipeptide/oligopeptide/nickel ABC transporter ATP-binding protein n=1 Tax=Cellulomonas gelida TaxID=1712 RepID=A0A4Y3KPH8_9CELL|nr:MULTISPECIES: ABC transporter ATP-binding protein [Cellulomonas]KMM46082.1 peptide ABC transporter ATPase [Cellulomonas sp. A375-1]GEA85813.1 dipeptide/oligopeptide/nickel ABC transporter ATP-binding protein [Cellulomonas gelida]GGL18345.1 dipeptide/oligopeptide/nickel ABC transporter ATP-binding protein [Cellulomonas gelida]
MSAQPVSPAAPHARGRGADPVLEIRNLSVDYGYDEPTHVLRQVSLTLNRGEVLGLAGESGCGKSTLAYAATRLLPPPGLITGGEVIFTDRDGTQRDILTLDDRALRASRWQDLAIVFQGAMNSLNPVHRIGRQIADAITAHRPGMKKPEALEKAAELLDLVGINPDRARDYPHQLSGGMRQRVMIAMALALDPQVLIMDEPTTALDVVMQRQIVEQIADLRERLGFSVVFITHDVSLLIEIADRIAIMYAGEIVEDAAALDVYRAPRHPYADGLLHSFPPLRGPRRELGGIPGSPPDLASLPTGCPFRDRCAHAFDACAAIQPELVPSAVPGDDPARRVACHLHTPALVEAAGFSPRLLPPALTHPAP